MNNLLNYLLKLTTIICNFIFCYNMPHLFLSSDISQTIKLFIDKAKIEPKNTKVIFIADGAEPYKFSGEDAPWIKTDRQAFLKEGFKVEEICLENLNKIIPTIPIPDVEANFNSPFSTSSDLNSFILHFCGGNTLYLLNKIRKCNLVATIQNLVLSDQIIYSGSSAGSMIVAPDLSIKKDLNDEPETWAKYLSDFTDYSGLNLVDFRLYGKNSW